MSTEDQNTPNGDEQANINDFNEQSASNNEADVENEESEPSESPHVHIHAIPFGRQGVHEGGVHGSVLSQTLAMVEEYTKPQPITLEVMGGATVPAQITKDGVKVIPISAYEEYLPNPIRRKGAARMTDLDSFIALTNRHKNEESVIFANDSREAPGLTTVIDYHDRVDHHGEDALANFGEHEVTFRFPVSDEWKTWGGMNGQPMEMAQFARFLEDNIINVMEPGLITFPEGDDPAKRFVTLLGGTDKIANASTLMDLATNLHVNETSIAGEVVRLNDGSGSITFQSDHQTTNAQGVKVVVPTMFALAIPVFRNDQAYRVFARLRYRKAGGKIIFSYELWRTDLVFDHAFDLAVEKVQEGTGLPVLIGSKEG